MSDIKIYETTASNGQTSFTVADLKRMVVKTVFVGNIKLESTQFSVSGTTVTITDDSVKCDSETEIQIQYRWEPKN